MKTIYDTDIYDLNNNNCTYTQTIKYCKKGKKVLDVGCATGFLGEFLHTHFNIEVIGVDYLDFHVKKSEGRQVYKKVIKIDLNNFTTELDEFTGYFDKIIILDVLEHLYEPFVVLKELSNLLKPSGAFVVSVPNISHGSIKSQILINDFEYTEKGLLDSTHIRFFTKSTFIEKLTENMFKIDEIKAVYSPFKINKKIPKSLADYIMNDYESAVFQYVFIFSPFQVQQLDQLKKNNDKFKVITNEMNNEKVKNLPSKKRKGIIYKITKEIRRFKSKYFE